MNGYGWQQARLGQPRADGSVVAEAGAVARALETMLVIAAANESAQSGKSVRSDYEDGYVEQALS